jgi:hypothetical protein
MIFFQTLGERKDRIKLSIWFFTRTRWNPIELFKAIYSLSLQSFFYIVSNCWTGLGWAGQDLALFMGRAGLYCTQSSNVTEPFRLASMAGLWFDSNSSQDGQERDEVTFNRLVLSWETESGRQHYSRLTRTGNNINPPEKKTHQEREEGHQHDRVRYRTNMRTTARQQQQQHTRSRRRRRRIKTE